MLNILSHNPTSNHQKATMISVYEPQNSRRLALCLFGLSLQKQTLIETSEQGASSAVPFLSSPETTRITERLLSSESDIEKAYYERLRLGHEFYVQVEQHIKALLRVWDAVLKEKSEFDKTGYIPCAQPWFMKSFLFCTDTIPGRASIGCLGSWDSTNGCQSQECQTAATSDSPHAIVGSNQMMCDPVSSPSPLDLNTAASAAEHEYDFDHDDDRHDQDAAESDTGAESPSTQLWTSITEDKSESDTQDDYTQQLVDEISGDHDEPLGLDDSNTPTARQKFGGLRLPIWEGNHANLDMIDMGVCHDGARSRFHGAFQKKQKRAAEYYPESITTDQGCPHAKRLRSGKTL